MASAAYEDDIPFLASALTFDALLWALPFTLVALAVFGYLVHGGADTATNIHRLFDRFFPAHAAGTNDPFALAEQAVERVVAARVRLSLFGLPLFVWFAWRLFGSIRIALNNVFDTEENRPYLVGKGLDLGLAVVCALLVTANTVVTLVVVEAPWLGRFVASLTTYLFSAAAFYLIYTVAPSRKVRWDTALIASAVASVAFEIAKKLYAFYLAHFATVDRVLSNTNMVAIVLFVLWIYYTMLVFLVGGEVAETYDLARRQREQRAILA